MTGQFRKDPFHVNRDKVSDNLTVVRKLRLPRGAQIRARRMFATAALAGLATINVNMPYAGNISITVTGATAGDTVLINNPFITGLAAQPIVVSSAPDVTAVLGGLTPGQITLTLTAGTNGVYIISVGMRTDRRNNLFSQ